MAASKNTIDTLAQELVLLRKEITKGFKNLGEKVDLIWNNMDVDMNTAKKYGRKTVSAHKQSVPKKKSIAKKK